MLSAFCRFRVIKTGFKKLQIKNMKTAIETQFESDSAEISDLANESLRLNAEAAGRSLANRRAEEAAEAEAEKKAAAEAKAARKRSGVLGAAATPAQPTTPPTPPTPPTP